MNVRCIVSLGSKHLFRRCRGIRCKMRVQHQGVLLALKVSKDGNHAVIRDAMTVSKALPPGGAHLTSLKLVISLTT